MAKKLASAIRIRLAILESLYAGWKNRPDPNHVFLLQQVWSEVYSKYGNRVDDIQSEGVWNSLRNEGLIEIHFMEDSTGSRYPAGRISDAGRSYLQQHKDQIRTRNIALFGAVTGTSGLLIGVIRLLLDLFS